MNVTLAGVTVPSVVSVEISPIVTSAVGWVVSTTVNVAVPPASVVVRPEVGVTVMPAASLSVLVTDTSAALSAVVGAVAARRRRGDDRVDDVAVVDQVVDAGHRHRLRRVPVRGRERHARRTDRALRRVARAQADRHVRRRLRVQHDRERRRAAAFGRRQAGGRADRDAGGVVVGVGHRHVERVQAVVARIGADRRRGHDRVGRCRRRRTRRRRRSRRTVCGTFQLALVNVRLAGLTVPSVGLLELSAMVTSAVGCEFSTTVKCAVPPASVVVRPEIGVTINAGRVVVDVGRGRHRSAFMPL